MLDLVPVGGNLCIISATFWGGARWCACHLGRSLVSERERDQRKGGERNHSSIFVAGEQGVIIAAVVFINERKRPIVGFSRVAPTLKDGGAPLVICLDIVLGEGDSEICVVGRGDDNQGSGEGWHDVALAGR